MIIIRSDIPGLLTSVDVVADLEEKVVITLRHILVTDGITTIARDLRAEFEDRAGREISRAVPAREPVSGKRQLCVHRLLNGELPARAVCVQGDYVLAEEVAAETYPRVRPEGLLAIV